MTLDLDLDFTISSSLENRLFECKVKILDLLNSEKPIDNANTDLECPCDALQHCEVWLQIGPSGMKTRFQDENVFC